MERSVETHEVKHLQDLGDLSEGGSIRTLFGNGQRKLFLAVMTLMAMVTGLLGLSIYDHFIATDQPPFSPLGRYGIQQIGPPGGPTQTITLDGLEAVFPLVTAGEDIQIEALKCNDSDEVVQVIRTRAWEMVEPAGFSVPHLSLDPSDRPPGCTRYTLLEPMPPQVLDRVRILAERGIMETVWRIDGTEWPLDRNGDRGVPAHWQSENFIIRVEE